MAVDLFWRFPHLPAYSVDYQKGNAELTYRPRLNMARLRVLPRQERKIADVVIAPLDVAGAHDALAKLFVAAFIKVPPLDTMPATTRRHAAESALKHTATGGDGVPFRPACLAATDRATGKILGAILLTKIGLRPDEWPEPSLPPILLNVTWLFVAPERHRSGIGSALLDRAINVLVEHRVPWLVSHIAEDNAAAMLFHWRHQFELVSWIRHANETPPELIHARLPSPQ